MSEDTERELHRYAIGKKSTLLLTNRRVIFDQGGFLGSREEIPLQQIVNVEISGDMVTIRRADGGSSRFLFGENAEEISQCIRDIVGGL